MSAGIPARPGIPLAIAQDIGHALRPAQTRARLEETMSQAIKWSVMASLALGLCAVPALAQTQQGQQVQEGLPERAPQELPLKETYKDVKEKEVKLADVPQSVRSTIDSWAQGGKVKEIKQYTAPDGRTQFEATIEQKDGKKVEVLLDHQGKVIRAGKEAQ